MNTNTKNLQSNNIKHIQKIKKNINYFRFITDIDSYIIDFLHILLLLIIILNGKKIKREPI